MSAFVYKGYEIIHTNANKDIMMQIEEKTLRNQSAVFNAVANAAIARYVNTTSTTVNTQTWDLKDKNQSGNFCESD